MRHRTIAMGVALGAALGLVLGTARWPVDPVRVGQEMSAGGGAVAAPARASFTLLPRPLLRISGLRADSAGVSVSAASAEVALRLDSLLSGHFAASGIVLHDADIHADLDQALAAGVHTPPLARIEVRGGAVEFTRPALGWATHLDVSDAKLVGGGEGGSLRLEVSGRWRDQPVDVGAELDAPLEAAQGGSSPLRFSLNAPLAQVRLAGDLTPGGSEWFRGQASAQSPSLASLAHWWGRAWPQALPPLSLQLSAHVGATTQSAKLDDAAVTLGGQRFEGAFAVSRAGGRFAVSGTLAAETLDLEALLGAPPAVFDTAGAWSDQPALPQPGAALDVDLRLSAGHVAWRKLALDNAAGAVSQTQGLLSLKLLESGFAHGALSGEVRIDGRASCRTQVSATLENGDFGQLLGALGAQDVTGQGSMKLAFHAQGLTPREIVTSAEGEATLEVSDGSVSSLNFEEALRRARRRLIDVARDMSAGATRFGPAHGRIEIGGGEARFLDATSQAPGVSLALTGALDLSSRAWRAHVAARESADDGQPTPDGARLDFALFGPWSGPVLTPLLPPAD